MSSARIFDEKAQDYDSWYYRNKLVAELEARLVEYVLRDSPRPVVEIGVGTGFFAYRIGCEYGLDPSVKMLEIAKKRLRGLTEIIVGVGEKTPFRSNVFGTVLLVVTLCFVDDPLAVLRESWRILRPGGEVVACIVPRDSPYGRYYQELAEKGHPYYSYARFYTVKEVEAMLVETGFRYMYGKGVLSTLPGEQPVWEQPSGEVTGKSFVCLKAVKEMSRNRG